MKNKKKRIFLWITIDEKTISYYDKGNKENNFHEKRGK